MCANSSRAAHDVAIARGDAFCLQATGVLGLVAGDEPPGGGHDPPPRIELTAVGEEPTHGARSAGIPRLLGYLAIRGDLAGPEAIQRGADALCEILTHHATVASYPFAAGARTIACVPWQRHPRGRVKPSSPK